MWQALKHGNVKRTASVKRYEPGVFLYDLKPSMANGEPAHCICPKCYEHKKRSILHGTSLFQGRETLMCHECSGQFIVGIHVSRATGGPNLDRMIGTGGDLQARFWPLLLLASRSRGPPFINNPDNQSVYYSRQRSRLPGRAARGSVAPRKMACRAVVAPRLYDGPRPSTRARGAAFGLLLRLAARLLVGRQR